MTFRSLLPLLTLIATALSASAQRIPIRQSPWPSDTRITLEENGCLISISAGGIVSVEGESGFEFDIGGIKEKVSRAELDQLVAEFLRIDYFSLNNRYEDKDDGCPVQGPDCTSIGIVTSFTFNGRSKRIAHHIYACLDRDGLSYPRELTNLEKQFKEIVRLRRR
jgi:hypothetical protein